MNAGVILSGGSGVRFGSELPKQYWTLNGRMVIEYSLRAFQESRLTDRYFAVVAPELCGNCPFQSEYPIPVVPGGATRNASMKAALDYIARTMPECQKVIVHEAARPFLTAEIIDDLFGRLDEYDAAIVTRPVTDALGSLRQWYVKREDYFLIQAPEAFRFPLLFSHFDPDSPVTAGVQQLPEGSRVLRYDRFPNNLKITYPEDLPLAEGLMSRMAQSPSGARPR